MEKQVALVSFHCHAFDWINYAVALEIAFDLLFEFWVTLYLKPLYTMHYEKYFNALIMPCNAPYDALFDPINNGNQSYNAF